MALPSGRAAVDRVVGACDVSRPVRSDEGRELRDLLGLSEALEKRLFGYRVPGPPGCRRGRGRWPGSGKARD